jgi:hypothetical protein
LGLKKPHRPDRPSDQTDETNGTDETDAISCFRTNVLSSVGLRVTLGYRALGIYESDWVTWFWIGDHKAYKKFIKEKRS